MNSLTRTLLFFAWIALTPLVVWMAIAVFAGQEEYLALARSGFLLSGLLAMIWGLLRGRARIALLGAVFVIVGFLSFRYGEFASLSALGLDRPCETLQRGMCRPFDRAGNLRLWHAFGVGELLLNGVLMAHGASPKRFLGANAILAAAVLGLVGLAA